MRKVMLATLVLVATAASTPSQLYSASAGQTPDATCVPWFTILGTGVATPTATGGALTLSTATCAEQVGYALLEPEISLPGTVWIEARVRVPSGTACSPVRRTVILSISPTPTFGQLVHIGPNDVIMTNSSGGPGTDFVSGQHVLDTSVYRTYRLTIDPFGASSLSVDGVVVLTSSITQNSSNHGMIPRIIWGNASNLAEGVSEWDYVDSNVDALGCELVQPAPGAPFLVCNRGMIPGREYINVFNAELCPGGPGAGPILGLCITSPTAIQLVQSQVLAVNTPPFRFFAPEPNPVWGPFPPIPITLDVVCFDITGGVLGAVSPVTRQTLQ